ncbi:PaaI family thioesterase [Bacteroidota bacterium]
MRKIKNPFIGAENYHCFACAPHHPFGLKMEFFEDGDELISQWKPDEKFQGWGIILHGGIQTTLMDEIAAWTVFVKLKTAGVTIKLETFFKRPVLLNQEKIVIKAVVKDVENDVASIHVKIFDNKEHLCTEGFIYYKLFPVEKAKTKLKYPGIEKFYM